MDPFGVFQILDTLFGRHRALAIGSLLSVIAAVWFYYFKIHFAPGVTYQTDGPEAYRQRDRYSKWRETFAEKGWFPRRIYSRMLNASLDRTDQFFGNPHSDTKAFRRYWHWIAFDRCLAIAIFYPVLSVLVVWHVTGTAGPTGDALALPENTHAAERIFSALSFITTSALGTLMAFYFFRRSYFWKAALPTLAASIASLSVVFLIGAEFETSSITAASISTFVLFGVVVVTTSSKSSGLLCVSLAIATAVALGGDGLWSNVGPTLVFLGCALLWGIHFQETSDPLRSEGFFAAFYLLAICAYVWLEYPSQSQSVSSDILLLFLGALPILNAIFDWLSIGATRFLLRLGQSSNWPGPFVTAIFDLLLATALLFLLMLTVIGYISLLNHLSVGGGGPPVLEMRPLLAELRADNPGPQVWWIYVTVFTTFLPSVFNLTLGFLAAARGIPILRQIALDHFLPEDPAELGRIDRFWASTILAAQLAVAIIAAMAVALLLISIALYGLDFIGANLLDVADWMIGYLEPAVSQ